jgi:hypothetical protein
MPYKVFPEGGKSAVYAVSPDGKKVGKRRGLHDGPKEAQAQIAAIMASEKKPKEAPETFTATSGDSITVTATASDGEAETKDYLTEDMIMGYVPVSGPLTFADMMAEEEAQEQAEHMHDLTYKFQRLASNIMASEVEDKAAALSALAAEYSDMMKACMAGEMDDKAKEIAKQIAGDNQPTKDVPATEKAPQVEPDPAEKSLFIWKEADTYRWLAAYSNNRRDDDNPPEIISSASHKEFDEALQKGEWPMPELWPWHVPFPVGVATFHAYDEASGFPVAGGYFYKGMEWAAEGMMEAGWDGTSHGMPSEWIQRDSQSPTILIRHRTKEISPLPNWAAANKLAFFIINKESSMADEKGLPPHKREEFVKAFGEERVTQIEEALADRSKSADEAGIEKKEQTQSEKAKEPTAADVVKGLEFIVEQLNALNDKVEARFKALEEATVKEEDQFDIVAQLRAKSAIGKEAARIDGRSQLAKDGPKETLPETPTVAATGGVPIGLVDGLFQLNQGWYNRGGEQR